MLKLTKWSGCWSVLLCILLYFSLLHYHVSNWLCKVTVSQIQLCNSFCCYDPCTKWTPEFTNWWETRLHSDLLAGNIISIHCKSVVDLYTIQAVATPLQGALNAVVYGWSRKAFRHSFNPLLNNAPTRNYGATPVPISESSLSSPT